MVLVDIYKFDSAERIGDLSLADEIFNIKPHDKSIFDVVIMQQAQLRQGTHKVKDKSEVRGGGKKPWKQKGTGRARHGSIRSPQWRGGGIVFGPTIEKNYNKKINKKVNKLALKSLFSHKIKDGKLIVIDNTDIKDCKTKTIVSIIKKYNVNKPLFVIEEDNFNLYLSARNIPTTDVLLTGEVKVLDLVKYDSIFITKNAINKIEEVLR